MRICVVRFPGICCLLVFFALCGNEAYGEMILDDGGTHTIDASNSPVDNGIKVYDAAGDVPTTLRVVDGGEVNAPTGAIEAIRLHDASVLDVTGGSIRGPDGSSTRSGGYAVHGLDNAVVNVSGGFLHGGDSGPDRPFGGQAMWANNDATVSITGGELQGGIGQSSGASAAWVGGGVAIRISNATLSGGESPLANDKLDGRALEVVIDAEARVYSGTFNGGDGMLAGFETTVSMYDGTVNARDEGLITNGNAVFSLFGGDINSVDHAVHAYGDSVFNIFGGSLNTTAIEIRAEDDSTVNIFGIDFNYPYGPIDDTSGTITGTLSDATVMAYGFLRDISASIYLREAPEPSTFVLLSVGILGLFVCIWRRRSLR